MALGIDRYDSFLEASPVWTHSLDEIQVPTAERDEQPVRDYTMDDHSMANSPGKYVRFFWWIDAESEAFPQFLVTSFYRWIVRWTWTPPVCSVWILRYLHDLCIFIGFDENNAESLGFWFTYSRTIRMVEVLVAELSERLKFWCYIYWSKLSLWRGNPNNMNGSIRDRNFNRIYISPVRTIYSKNCIQVK